MKLDKTNERPITIPTGIRGSVITSIFLKKGIARNPSPDRVLANTSSKLNQTLPMMVDPITRLDLTVQRPGCVLSYKYTLLGLKASRLNKEKIRAAVEPTLLQNYKTNPSMAALRRISAILKYTYFDESGAFILEVEIDPAKFHESSTKREQAP